MSDPTTGEITDALSQFEALLGTVNMDSEAFYTSARVLVQAASSKLSEMQPSLPKEPGWYETVEGGVVELDAVVGWVWAESQTRVSRPELLMPLVRLVRQDARFDIENVIRAYENASYGEGWDAVDAVLNGPRA